ncbi:DoxX family protein [Bacteroidota bacterium]|nr:DoxX family protein [Bacteroidota bacterium]MDA9726949.1 DoxX family protein [Bacteroidota bacterium]
MDIIMTIKLITSLGIFNVWLLRYNKNTEYRGGNAKSLKEEFETYGLNSWFMYIIGAIKIGVSILFIVSCFNIFSKMLDVTIFYASVVMSLIMIGAILMHIKVNDPFKKSVPAITMLTLYSIIILNYFL